MDKDTAELALKTVGAFRAGIGWLYQTRATYLRNKIKLDLEILEKSRALLDATQSSRVQSNAERLMGYLYRDDPGKPRRSWPDLVVGIGFFLAAILWIIIAIRQHFGVVWQLGVTAMLLFVGLGGVLNGIAPSSPASTDDPTSTSTASKS